MVKRTPVIEIKHLCKYFPYGKNEVTKSLDDISLDIYSGEFICFFGPSGCGKSTLMNMIAGLDSPTSGEINIRGESLAKLKSDELAFYRRTKIGMVFQQFNLIPTMNLVENVAMPLTFAQIGRNRRLKRAENILDAIGLAGQKRFTPSEISGGQQQRVAIARALAPNPWILLADEPTGNLDSKSADEVMDLLSMLCRKSRRTVILITHNPDYLRYVDKVYYLRDGKIIKTKVNKRVKTSDKGGPVDITELAKTRTKK